VIHTFRPPRRNVNTFFGQSCFIRADRSHGHFVIPRCRHVAILITFTPDPPLIKMPATFCPPMMASILGHSQSITRSSTSVSCTACAGAVAIPSKVRRIPSLNRGTSHNNCSSVIVTWIPAKSEMSGTTPLLDSSVASVSTALPFAARWAPWVNISAFCCAFASSTHYCACSLTRSCSAPCSVRAWLHVVTNCSVGVIKLTDGPLLVDASP
jgi:hypothetical protein